MACVGEDENIQFVHHSQRNHRAGHKVGDWTYEMDKANQITLRYWISEFGSIEEPLSNPPCITTLDQRSDLQDLLSKHVHILKAKVIDVNG